MDFQRAQQVGVSRIQSTPCRDRGQLGRIGLTAARRGLKRHRIDIRFLVMHFRGGKFRPSDWLLHRVDEREQMRRREHPVPALDRALEYMRDAIRVRAGPQPRGLRIADCKLVDVFAEPLPHAHEFQIVWFPTEVRLRANGLCNMLGRGATVVSPFAK